MEIFWTPESFEDLESLYNFISLDSDFHDERVVRNIQTIVEVHIKRFPEIGHPGRVKGTREFAVVGTSYVIIYRIKDKKVEILRIYHSSRMWPEKFD